MLLAKASFAADLSQDQQNIIKQNIQTEQNFLNERKNIAREKQLEEIKKIGKSKSEIDESEAKEAAADDSVCRVINDFIFVGNSKFSTRFLTNKFVKKYSKKSGNNCFKKSDLNELRREIEGYYLNKGFVVSRVYFDLKNLADGFVMIVIEEGKLDKIELKDNSKLNDKLPFRRSLQKFFAFPFSKGDVINLRDIEQGIDQINRLSSQSAKMSIDSSNYDGYSDIIVENKISELSVLSVGADNAGNKRTGKMRHKLGFNQDNLLGINDNILLNYSQTNDAGSDTRYSKSIYVAGSFPFGYWTAGGSYAYSHYLLTTAGSAGALKSSGNSESKTFYLDRVLSRGQKYKISLKGELERNDTDSYLEDTYIPINSRQTTNSNIYLSNIFYLKNGSVYLQPKYSKGWGNFGAKKDEKGLDEDQARAQFDSYGLYGQINTNFNVPKTEFPLNYKLTFDSSYSEDSLYGNNQFAIGGRYSVRGFQETVISGDNGYYVRNDLKANLSSFWPKNIVDIQLLNFVGQKITINSLLSKTSVGVFYDYGYVRNRIINEPNDEGHLSGLGAALSYAGKNFTWDLSYARGLHSPQFLRNIDRLAKEGEIIYLSVNFSLGLL